MAQSIESHQLTTSRVSEPASPGLWKLRLALGWTILFAALVGLFAVSWDIQWHTALRGIEPLSATDDHSSRSVRLSPRYILDNGVIAISI